MSETLTSVLASVAAADSDYPVLNPMEAVRLDMTINGSRVGDNPYFRDLDDNGKLSVHEFSTGVFALSDAIKSGDLNIDTNEGEIDAITVEANLFGTKLMGIGAQDGLKLSIDETGDVSFLSYTDPEGNILVSSASEDFAEFLAFERAEAEKNSEALRAVKEARDLVKTIERALKDPTNDAYDQDDLNDAVKTLDLLVRGLPDTANKNGLVLTGESDVKDAEALTALIAELSGGDVSDVPTDPENKLEEGDVLPRVKVTGKQLVPANG